MAGALERKGCEESAERKSKERGSKELGGEQGGTEGQEIIRCWKQDCEYS